MCDINKQNCLSKKDKKKYNFCNNIFLVLGHGITLNSDRIKIPPNFNIITFSSINEAFPSYLNDPIFLELFARKTDDTKYTHHQMIKLLSSPLFGNHSYLDDLEIKHHPPGCDISNIVFSYRAFDNLERLNLMKTGIYKIGDPEIKNVFNPGSKEIFYQELFLDNINQLESKAADVFKGSDDRFISYIKSGNNITELMKGHKKQGLGELFRLYPEGGTFFMPICRTCHSSLSKTTIPFLRAQSNSTNDIFKDKLDLLFLSTEDKNMKISNDVIKIIFLSNFRLIKGLLSNYNSDSKLKIIQNILRIINYNSVIANKLNVNKAFDINNILTVNKIIFETIKLCANNIELFDLSHLNSFINFIELKIKSMDIIHKI